MSRRSSEYSIRPQDREEPTDGFYEIEGRLYAMSSKEETPDSIVFKRTGKHHVFGYGVDLEGDAGVQRWMHDVLNPHKYQLGARVRITVEVFSGR